MNGSARTFVPGMVLFYDLPHRPETTIQEHVDAFARHSRFPVYSVNLCAGMPPALWHFEFPVYVFHYTLSPCIVDWFTPDLEEYINRCPRSHKVAIFQDEIWYFQERFAFLNRCGVDCLYSRHKPRHVREIYAEHVRVKKYAHYLAGYVAEGLTRRAGTHGLPHDHRPIDVGYRGRLLPFYLGRGAQEKVEIGRRFTELAAGQGLQLDIAMEESDRLIGSAWDRFLGSCKAVLGVEGGVSVIDRDGKFRRQYEHLIAEKPDLTFDDFAAQMGDEFAEREGKIDYRCLTPRHFEAAAYRALQILFEGNYDGLMKPDVHYVPLRKDFSNFWDVLQVLKNRERCLSIIEQAHRDLIASGRYTYARFIKEFDERLMEDGVKLQQVDPVLDQRLQQYLRIWQELAVPFSYWRHRVLLSHTVGAAKNWSAFRTFRVAFRAYYQWRLRRIRSWMRKTNL